MSLRNIDVKRYLPVDSLLKNELFGGNIWLGVILLSVVIFLSCSIVVLDKGLSVLLHVTRDDDDDKWLLLYNERLLGICGLAAELVVDVVVVDKDGALVEKIWLVAWSIDDDEYDWVEIGKNIDCSSDVNGEWDDDDNERIFPALPTIDCCCCWLSYI